MAKQFWRIAIRHYISMTLSVLYFSRYKNVQEEVMHLEPGWRSLDREGWATGWVYTSHRSIKFVKDAIVYSDRKTEPKKKYSRA